MAMIDMSNILTFYNLSEDDREDNLDDFEKKEVWSLVWAEEDPDHCVFMEKHKLFFKRGDVTTQAVYSDSYVVDFSQMEVMTVDIEEILTIFDGEE